MNEILKTIIKLHTFILGKQRPFHVKRKEFLDENNALTALERFS
jgi:hypothetical protein